MAPSGSSKGNAAAAASRLDAVSRSLATSSTGPTASSPAAAHRARRELLGHLTLDELRLPVYGTEDTARLPRDDLLLEASDPVVAAEVEWLMKKWTLRALVAPSSLLP